MSLFSTHLWAIQFPSLWIVCSCSLAAKLSSKILFLSWGSQSSVQLYFTSLSVFRWLVAFKRVSDSKNVISIWFLTEKSYMFHRMLPRLFSKTITKVIIIVSLNILKYTVAYSCSSYVQPLGNTFLLLASLGLIRTIWSFLGTGKSEKKKKPSMVKCRPFNVSFQLDLKPRNVTTNVFLNAWALSYCACSRLGWGYFLTCHTLGTPCSSYQKLVTPKEELRNPVEAKSLESFSIARWPVVASSVCLVLPTLQSTFSVIISFVTHNNQMGCLRPSPSFCRDSSMTCSKSHR